MSDLPKLPVPFAIVHQGQDDEDFDYFPFAERGAVDRDETYPNGVCPNCTRLFTEAQLIACWNAAIAWAAERTENMGTFRNEFVLPQDCAAAIREGQR